MKFIVFTTSLLIGFSALAGNNVICFNEVALAVRAEATKLLASRELNPQGREVSASIWSVKGGSDYRSADMTGLGVPTSTYEVTGDGAQGDTIQGGEAFDIKALVFTQYNTCKVLHTRVELIDAGRLE